MNVDNNSVVLITGATSGIGLATASLLAGRGYKVYGTYRQTSNTKELDQAIEKSNGMLEKILMDVSDPSSVQNAVDHILTDRKIDVVINNAGYAMIGTVESCTLEEQKKLFDTNFFGPVNVIQAVLPHFRDNEKGQIINIGSVAGITPFPAIEIYSASKFALRGLTESMAVSLHPFNIKVSIVEPGSVKTIAASENSPIGTKELGPDNPYENFHKVANEMCINNLANGKDPIELAELIHDIVLEEKPSVFYQFGDYAKSAAQKKFQDPTGNINVESQIKFFNDCGMVATKNPQLI